MLRSVYNLFMIETLYRTETPEKGKSECYVLVLASRVGNGEKAYSFMQEHGHWNDELERFHYAVNSINIEDRLNYQDARALYDGAKRKLAAIGFIHCFAADGQRQEPYSDQVVEPEMATA